MSEGIFKTAIKQENKKRWGSTGSYANDGPQAYYMLKEGNTETWFTTAQDAIVKWETLSSWAGAELWVKRTGEPTMRKIRPYN